MAYHSVIIKNYLNNFEEYAASEALSPGMLVEPVSGAATIKKHATEGGDAIPMFAIEDALQGKGLEDAYVAGDQVRVWIAQRGDEVYAQLEDEQTIVIGDLLESNGGGYLQKHLPDEASEGSAAAQTTVYAQGIVAVALEALDLSSLSAAGSSDTPTRQFIRVRIV